MVSVNRASAAIRTMLSTRSERGSRIRRGGDGAGEAFPVGGASVLIIFGGPSSVLNGEHRMRSMRSDRMYVKQTSDHLAASVGLSGLREVFGG